jgi:hypothetical protein
MEGLCMHGVDNESGSSTQYTEYKAFFDGEIPSEKDFGRLMAK